MTSPLRIHANQIEAWANGPISARHEFAALLRRLVYSTSTGISKLDFPAFENAERPGWDGILHADIGTPWIPQGESGWEFGVNKDPRQKAEGDFATRTEKVPEETRTQMTFVFVTPRNWPGKNAWVEECNKKCQWKDVRAYDASDLEQWIETSVPAQIWCADHFSLGSGGLIDLPTAWRRWANATKPPLKEQLFSRIAENVANKLTEWLAHPSKNPFRVVANSTDEGLAALACAFEIESLRRLGVGEQVVIVETADSITKLASTESDLILILPTADAQRATVTLEPHQRTILIGPQNGFEKEPNFTIDLVDSQDFHLAMHEMGINDARSEQLIHESGRSPTVLRRRLAINDALREPHWAKSKDTARNLIPLMMAGVWDSSRKADQAVLSALAGIPFDDIERIIAEQDGEEDSPLWSIGAMRGVASKTDCFYAVRWLVTRSDLDRFFTVAQQVLSEEDPALELPEEKRWAANIYGKSRQHSPALRKSLCGTLVLLSVHGENLFQKRLGYPVIDKVNKLIRSLLVPLTGAAWQTQKSVLPFYAEAAPEIFLSLLEDDLRSSDPKLLTLMAPADASLFASPARTGLLWALEALAWHPDRLIRVIDILARLAQIPIADNYGNRPESSLAAIFRCWWPQTAAPLSMRIRALERLVRVAPEVGWRICLRQFDHNDTAAFPNAKPRWRDDAIEVKEGASPDEARTMARHAIALAVQWPNHDEQTLGDLIRHLKDIPGDQDDAWDAIRKWLTGNPSDEAKAKLRETIRRSIPIFRSSLERSHHNLSSDAQNILATLEPQDVLWRHHWLFAERWIRKSTDELLDETIDFQKLDQDLEAKRLIALSEIWNCYGWDGIIKLCHLSKEPKYIGSLLAKMPEPSEIINLVLRIIVEEPEPKLDRCLSGLLFNLSNEILDSIYEEALGAGASRSQISERSLLHLLLHSRFAESTWKRLDPLSKEQRHSYWAEVHPKLLYGDEAKSANYAVDALLAVERPRAAFAMVHMVLEALATDQLFRLLWAIATVDKEPQEHYRLQPDDVEKAFETLSLRDNIADDSIINLEIPYISLLSNTKYGIPRLERRLAESPDFFVQALVWAYLREDRKEDPLKFKVIDRSIAENQYRIGSALLSHARRIPGTGDTGEIDREKLRDWIVAVRTLAREYGREEMGDTCIGRLLARSPDGSDGIWPAEGIRDVLEEVETATLLTGMLIGRLNARGVVGRGEGEEQERDLAKQYSDWSSQLTATYPVTARLLSNIANKYNYDAHYHDERARLDKRIL